MGADRQSDCGLCAHSRLHGVKVTPARVIRRVRSHSWFSANGIRNETRITSGWSFSVSSPDRNLSRNSGPVMPRCLRARRSRSSTPSFFGDPFRLGRTVCFRAGTAPCPPVGGDHGRLLSLGQLYQDMTPPEPSQRPIRGSSDGLFNSLALLFLLSSLLCLFQEKCHER